MVDAALLDHTSLDDYLQWFYNQAYPADIQLAYTELSMFLSREVNNLYTDLSYRGDHPLEIDYGFLHNWDLRITGNIPTPPPDNDCLGDYIPKRQRQNWP
jgi:hypothetical protein